MHIGLLNTCFVQTGDFCKARECLEPLTNGGSASSPSPPNGYHQGAPLSHLRDMLTSDLEHSSNDTSDVKDLSFRHQQPQQAAVITSTGPAAPMDTHPPPDSNAPVHQHSSFHAPDAGHAGRHAAEAAADAAEHNNNSYKFKNYIQQRFSQVRDLLNLIFQLRFIRDYCRVLRYHVNMKWSFLLIEFQRICPSDSSFGRFRAQMVGILWTSLNFSYFLR